MTLSLRILAMRNFIFLGLLTPIFLLGATEMEINNEAKQVIYQYAEIIDSRNFDKLDSIMWPDFSMSGGYDLKGIDGFMGAMNYLAATYDSTMHFIGNIDGAWDGNIYKGKTYCIASHMFVEDGQSKKLDMGIIYEDTLERRGEDVKFVNRSFNLQWQKTELLDPQ